MSFAAWALRTVTVKAIKGRTIAGDIVGDSQLADVATLAEKEAHPFVRVYTGQITETPESNDLFAPMARHVLVIETGVGAQMKLPRGAGMAWGIAESDEMLSYAVDRLSKQIRHALVAPDNAWGDLWPKIVTKVHKITTETGGDAERGVRYAARQMAFDVTTLREPMPGKPPGPVWGKFLELVAADADMAPRLAEFRDFATGGSETWPDYATLRAGLGISHSNMRIIFPDTPRVEP